MLKELIQIYVQNKNYFDALKDVGGLANDIRPILENMLKEDGAVQQAVYEAVGAVGGGEVGAAAALAGGLAIGLTGGPLVVAVLAGSLAGGALGAEGGTLLYQLEEGFLKKYPGKYNDIFPGPFPRGLNPNLNTDFLRARKFIERRDPLALDLDGDGLETIGITSDPVLFDHDGDGIKTGTGWLTSDDAFLALDKNGNGAIDNGNELFGVDTVLANGQQASSGFAALAELDSNQDGQFSNADTRFADLRVWRDLNQDGLSQSDELHTLAAADIASINVTGSASNIALAGGNVLSARGSYTKSDGQTGTVGEFITGSTGNLDLVDNPFYREFADHIPLTDQAKVLPNMAGSGMVRDLAEAVSLDRSGQLATALSRYAAASTRAEQLAQLDALIEKWGSTSTMLTSKDVNRTKADYFDWEGSGLPPPDFRRESDDTAIEHFAATSPDLYRKITALEQFNGMTFLAGRVEITLLSDSGRVSHQVRILGGSQPLLDSSWEALRESVYHGLLQQTRLKPYLAANDLNWREMA